MTSGATRLLGAGIFAALLGLLPVACLIGPESVAGPCAEKGCDDGNPCTDDVCADDGFCDHAPAAAPPDDGNECTDDVCDGLDARHTQKAQGTPCGAGGLLACDAGICVCASKSECGVDTPCIAFSCTGGACASVNTAVDVAVDGAGAFDCKKRVCDGAGNIVTVADKGDAPADDVGGDCHKKGCDDDGNIVTVADTGDAPADEPNPCTTEGCNGGTPIVHVPKADGTPCAPPSCGGSDPAFMGFAAATCTAGACGAPAATACDLYTCKDDKSACRNDCSGDSQCTSAAYCDKSASKCAARLDQGAACGGDNQCKSTFCRNGYCCNNDCKGNCARCDLGGLQGTCSSPVGSQGGCNAGSLCDAAFQCKKINGQGCNGGQECGSGFCPNEGNAGKVCCDSACDGLCESCKNNKTGQNNGVCAHIFDKTDPDNECSGNCNGNGNGNGCCKDNGTCY